MVKRSNMVRAIAVLRSTPKITIGELATMIDVSYPVAASYVQALELAGHIQRIPTKPDGRGRPADLIRWSGGKVEITLIDGKPQIRLGVVNGEVNGNGKATAKAAKGKRK